LIARQLALIRRILAGDADADPDST